MSDEKKIAVIDGNSLMHRAFHAVPEYMMTPEGVHTNAVFGFISMFLKLVDDFHPDGIICAFDAGIPDFRFEAIKKYKAQRPPTDPNLKEQFPLIEKLLGAMGVPVVKVAGYEGDDILGTLSAKGDEMGIKTYLVSGDRDILQLASANTSVVATRTGMSDVKVYGPEEVKERYGIGPEMVPDFIGLKGDPSDNIPGVPGIGEKTAAKLLKQYGSAKGIIEHRDELKGKVSENINDNIDVLEAGIIVATIVKDLDLDVDIEGLKFPDFESSDVVEAFRELGITAHVSKILALQDDASAATDVSDDERIDTINGIDAYTEFDRALAAGDELAVILEDSAQEQLFGGSKTLAVCTGKKVCIFKDLIEDVLIKTILECKVLITPDSKSLIQVLIPADSSEPAKLEYSQIDPSKLFDLSIAGYLLNSTRSNYDMPYLTMEYLSQNLPEREKPKHGQPVAELTDDELATQACMALKLHSVMSKKLESDGSMKCFEQIEMPLIPVLVMLERAGLEINVDRIQELSIKMGSDMQGLSAEIFEEVGEEFNIGSPKQLATILFDKLGLPAKKKTRTGYSTDASVLEDLSKIHHVPELVLEYRELSKIKSTYLDTLPEQRRGDGRVHTSFNQTITATGRLSSSNPNLQNIPVRSELGREIRTAFGPYKAMVDDGGAVFLSADYSQIELRLLAHMSGDQGLIDAFLSGRDFHLSTAAQIFSIPPEDVTPDLRSRAKAVNFGIVYGQQAFGLGKSLHIPMREAQEMIDRYFTAYPRVKEYLEGLVSQAKELGYVETIFGRKRHVPEVHSGNPAQRQAGERVAMNHPMQGSAADIIKIAMINVQNRLVKEEFKSVMLLQVHDELDFSCPKSEIEKLSNMVVEEMTGVADLKVPMNVSVSYGDTWAEAK